MFAALAVLFALAPRPVPDHQGPIDSLRFSFHLPNTQHGHGGLTVAADGTVTYSHTTAPFTGSGGQRVGKTWHLAPAERTELFRKLAADGLLDAEGKSAILWDEIRVTSGRWFAVFPSAGVPAKAMSHLEPYLKDRTPWPAPKPGGDKTDAPPVPKPGVLGALWYTHARADGDYAAVYLTRDGSVLHRRHAPKSNPVEMKWTIPAKEMEAILDGLAANGLFHGVHPPRPEKTPYHSIDAYAGRWRTVFYPAAMPEPIRAGVRPLLTKADPEFWK